MDRYSENFLNFAKLRLAASNELFVTHCTYSEVKEHSLLSRGSSSCTSMVIATFVTNKTSVASSKAAVISTDCKLVNLIA